MQQLKSGLIGIWNILKIVAAEMIYLQSSKKKWKKEKLKSRYDKF